MIFDDSAPDMVTAIKTQREFYPYNLDLVDKKVLFYNTQAQIGDVKEIDIDLIATQDELKKLQKNINDFAQFLKIF